MEFKSFMEKMSDGQSVFVYQWMPENRESLKGIVQIFHGMAEHAERYTEFSSQLIEAGYGVYAHDHRGHGRTAGSLENVGYFADRDGWARVVEDTYEITQSIKAKHADLPVFVFGHSMGSFILRTYLFKYGSEIDGAIISGTASNPGALVNVGLVLAKLESMIKGAKNRSKMMNHLSFASFNKAFEPARTDFDWLSRDPNEVDKYINDPYCGGIFTAGFYKDLLSGVKQINRKKNIRKVPQNLPIYMFSGEKDPVGNDGKGVKKVYSKFKKVGIKDIDCRLYEGGRHEMLNEINKHEVYQDVISWLDKHV